MARRKKKTEGLLATNPDAAREVIAAALFLVGILLLLGLFGGAGKVGALVAGGFGDLFGFVRYIFPFLFIALGAGLFLDRLSMRPLTSVAVTALLLGLASFANNGGGIVGHGLFGILEQSIGSAATYIALFAIIVFSVILLLNTSFKSVLGRFGGIWSGFGRNREPRASVFETVGKGRKPGDASTQVLSPQAMTAGAANWQFPPTDLLELSQTKPNAGNIAKNVETIQKTLKDFGITVAMGDVNIGPTVTQYTLKPDEGVKLNQITARVNDLSLSLAAHPLRIEAPIPGKAAVGVEVPNKVVAMVTLREVLESSDFKAAHAKLGLALGRDVAGAPFVVDLEKMPHLLIAGATGSGKSVAINSIITALCYQHSPATLRLILVDPKRVEFTAYNGIPHLLSPVIVEVDKTVSALRWAVAEMERRFHTFSEAGKRNIEAYNTGNEQKMPYIVIIIDELADLMAQSANEVEAAIVRLAQMARATGIHLVVATQRPSVDVITGLIKANITSRIAFAVASQVDSRTVLDMAGADKLLGNGDMLFIGNEFGKPKRVQGSMVGDREIGRITQFLREQGTVQYDETIMNYHPPSKSAAGGDGEIDDTMYEEAKQLVMQAGKASASLLQRRLRVGYARAARLLDILEDQGVIGPPDGARPRDVLIDNSLDLPSYQPHSEEDGK